MEHGEARQLPWEAGVESAPVAFAEVIEATQGRALRVLLGGDALQELPVCGHARDLSPVMEGDRVVIMVDTARGAAFISACCADAGEAPRVGLECRGDGTYVLHAGEGDIRLEVNGAELELRRDGRIVIDGEEVTSRARGESRITGRRVAVN